jgi:hypothetical protein
MKSVFVIGCLLFLTIESLFSQSRIDIDLTNQRVYFIRDGYVILDAPVSSGRPGHITPTGNFKVTSKDRDHTSSYYGFFGNPQTKRVVVPDADTSMKCPPGLEFVHAPMYYYIQFAPATGLHAGILPGYPMSHGCVHVPDQDAVRLFQLASVGTPVHVYGTPDPNREYYATRRLRYNNANGSSIASNIQGSANRVFSHFKSSFQNFWSRGDNSDSRRAAMDRFDAKWERKLDAVDSQIEDLNDRLDRASGSRRALIKVRLSQFQRYKRTLNNQRREERNELLSSLRA